MTYQTRDVSESEMIQAINAEWLTDTLSQFYSGLQVRSAKIEQILQGAAVKVKVRLSFNDVGKKHGLPEVVYIKGGFKRQDPSWFYAVQAAEMFAYRDIAIPSKVNAPTIFFVGFYPTDDHAVIIMEDLSARNVTFGHATKVYTYDQAAGVLDTLAKLHAYGWNNPALHEPPISEWLENLHHGSLGERHESLVQQDEWAYYCSLPRGLGLPRKFKDAGRMYAALKKGQSIQNEGPYTIAHGDPHIGNTFVDGSGAGGLYDWNCRHASWQYDVPYFLVSALDVTDRRKWEQSLLKHYLVRLEAYGVDAPDFDEAWWKYRCGVIFGLVTWVGNGDEKGQFQLETVNLMQAMQFAWAAMDHDTLELLT